MYTIYLHLLLQRFIHSFMKTKSSLYDNIAVRKKILRKYIFSRALSKRILFSFCSTQTRFHFTSTTLGFI